MNKIIFFEKSATQLIAKMLNIDISNIDINKIGGFDKDGIIFNDINSIIDYVDKIKE